MKKIHIGTLIIAIIIPLAIGVLSAALSYKGMEMYGTMAKPPLSPPPWVFSVAWTLLYILMGLASYFVIVKISDTQTKTILLVLYAIQLVLNFIWSPVFFNWHRYLLAFILLLIILYIVIVITAKSFKVERMVSYLLMPYVIWLVFAAYLNLGTYILSI